MPKVKKHSLRPIAYDEISLVDDGAAGSAQVLIMKRRIVADKDKETKPPKNALKKDKKKKGNKKPPNLSDPCSTGTSSTGAKETNPNKKSNRGKNWKEERHKRTEDGKFNKTPSDSKSKYGKGGTTKSKIDAACRRKKKGKGKKKLKSSLVTKSSMSSWDSDAHLIALMERK